MSGPRLEKQPWMTEAGTRAVLSALEAGGGKARFVGGCVRDALLGRPIADIDIATPMRPERALELLEAAGIKVVPTGLQHGTVTAVVPPRHYEVTSLRRDVETFGRHARVEYGADWAEDAARRDFTMNALFLDADGAVIDTVGGLDDLRAGKVRFVGEPERRIREDVLRLLRFYRFHAHYDRGGADEAARGACRELAHLLPTLSGERVAVETLKLLGAPEPLPTLRLMQEDGVLKQILPEAASLDRLARLVPIEGKPDPVRRLAALLPAGTAAAETVADRLKLSTAVRERLAAIAAPPQPVDLDGDERQQRRALHRLGRPLYRDLVLAAAATQGRGRPAALLAQADAWDQPSFPIRGQDLLDLGLAAGPEVGRTLGEVRSWWEDGDFQAGREACLAKARELAGRPVL